MSRKVEHILRAELGSMPLPEPRAEHLTETATLSLAAYRSRRPLRRIGVPEMVVSQIRFIAAPIWALQAAVVLCICLLLHLRRGELRGRRPGSAQHVLRFCRHERTALPRSLPQI